MRKKKSLEIMEDIVIKAKPWGREIWFAWTPAYAGKILEVSIAYLSR